MHVVANLPRKLSQLVDTTTSFATHAVYAWRITSSNEYMQSMGTRAT